MLRKKTSYRNFGQVKCVEYPSTTLGINVTVNATALNAIIKIRAAKRGGQDQFIHFYSAVRKLNDSLDGKKIGELRVELVALSEQEIDSLIPGSLTKSAEARGKRDYSSRQAAPNHR